MKYLIACFFILPIHLSGQNIPVPEKQKDSYFNEINKNIFRINLGLATDTKVSLTANYEREITRPLTLNLMAGPAFRQEYLYTDAYRTKVYKFTFNAVAAAELRYYIGLKKREKLQRASRNYSGCYISVEELLNSMSFIVLNDNGEEKQPGYHASFINLGFQKQFKNSYWHVFIGTRFPGSIYSNSTDFTDIIHAGVAIGKSFQ